MGILQRIGNVFSGSQEKRSLENPNVAVTPGNIDYLFTGGDAASGINVNENTALRSTPVWAAVNLIASSIGSLPCLTYERLEQGKRRATEHPVYRLLKVSPNEQMTPAVLCESLAAQMLLYGNGYAYIERKGSVPVSILPLISDRTSAQRVNGNIVYFTKVGNQNVMLRPDEVLHVPGLTLDGVNGLSPVSYTKEAIALAIAAEKYGAAFFGNGATLGGVLEHPGKLGDAAKKYLSETWAAVHQGVGRAHRTAILEEGLKWTATTATNDKAQFLELRKFQIAEVARIFHVPAHMIGDLEHATFSNIEHQALEYVKYTLRPWLVKIEQEITRKLFSESEQETYFVEFLTDALERGDLASRTDAQIKLVTNGLLSRDEARAMENRPPLPDGEGSVFVTPLNLAPVGSQQETPPQSGGVPSATDSVEAADEAVRSLPLQESAAIQTPPVAIQQDRTVEHIAARQRLAGIFSRLLGDAASRALTLESDALAKIVSDGGNVRARLADAYAVVEEPIRRTMEPVAKAYAEAVAAQVAHELDDAAAPLGLTTRLNDFALAYARGYAARHVAASKRELNKTLDALGMIGAGDAVRAKVAEWQQTRSAAIAEHETVRAKGAFAREAFAELGRLPSLGEP